MSSRWTVLLVSLVAVGAGLFIGAWSLFLRPIKVEALTVQQNVPVQVFGLGTVEARVTSKIGFKVSGVLVDLRLMSATVSLKVRCSRGSIPARRALGLRAPRLRSNRPKPICKERRPASKSPRPIMRMPRASVNADKAGADQVTSVEAAETAQAARTLAPPT